MAIVAKVGKKGEIVIRKSIREKAGIKPGEYVLLTLRDREIIIKKIGSAKDLLEMPKLVKLSKEELEKIRRKIHKEMEGAAISDA